MAIIGPPNWYGQTGDYSFLDYRGERPTALGTVGDPNYLLHSYCCCNTPSIGLCCTTWHDLVLDYFLTSGPGCAFETEWDLPIPGCGNLVLTYTGVGEDWGPDLIICGSAQITAQIDCRPYPDDPTRGNVYWLQLSCLDGPDSFSWEGPSVFTDCPLTFNPVPGPPFVLGQRYGPPATATWGPIPADPDCFGIDSEWTLGGSLYPISLGCGL